MPLNIQLYSFLVSFVYGFIYFILLEVNSRFIYSSKVAVKVMSSFIFVMFNILLYFIILMKINNGYIHFYFFLCIILGYFLCKVIYKKICKKK